MASLLRKRLQCFYCGSRSSRPPKGPVHDWKCPECQAVNYLDENGEITDPPVADASSNTRPTQYALPLQSEAPLQSSSSQSAALFCSTCLKNQHLLTQTLAAYLPPPSHPDYEAYEASYPTYRKSLEERYPQVCENCEPRIRERIRQAGYAAKADHLRRMMERSKSGRSRRNTGRLKWRSLVVLLGAIAFWVSLAGQLAWNTMGAMSGGNSSAEFKLGGSPSLPTFRSCLSSVRHAAVPSECRTATQSYAGFALMLGGLAVWWNPKLAYKAQGRPGRIIGLREYYRIQIVVLVTRFAAWAVLQDDMITGLNPNLGPIIHALVGIFTAVAIIGSRAVIKFDTNSIVTWQDHVEPLVQKPQRNAEIQLPTPADSQEGKSNAGSGFERFPIANLASSREPPPATLAPQYDAFDDGDAMDWTPSQETFQPNVNPGTPLSQAQSTSSLFQGKLPPVPKPPAWQLRNRNPEPATKPMQNKPNPFHNAPVSRPTPVDNPEEPAERSEVVMAPPKFFPPSDLRADTGLESLFDRTFSLADEPSEIRKKQSFSSDERAVMMPAGRRTSYVLKCGLLSITLVMLTSMQTSSMPRNTIETTVLATCFLIAGFSLLESLMKPMAFWSVIDFIFPGFELLACVYLAILRSQETYSQIQFDRIGQGLAAFMLVQELLALRATLAATAKPTTPSSMSEPQQAQKPQVDSYPAQSTLGGLSLDDSSPPNPQTRFGVGATNANSFGSNNGTSNSFLGSTSKPSQAPSQAPSNFYAANTANRNYAQSPASFSRQNGTSFQSNNLNGSAGISHKSPQPISYPPPFSSFSRPPADAPPSFSSFGPTLPEKVLSPASAASTTEYASSNTSEPPSPQFRVPPYSPVSTRSRRSARSPSITGLTLDDGPSGGGGMPRYSLRSRR